MVYSYKTRYRMHVDITDVDHVGLYTLKRTDHKHNRCRKLLLAVNYHVLLVVISIVLYFCEGRGAQYNLIAD